MTAAKRHKSAKRAYFAYRLTGEVKYRNQSWFHLFLMMELHHEMQDILNPNPVTYA